MEETFKTKYTISHWWPLLEPVIGFVITGVFILDNQAQAKEIAVWANIPFTGPSTAEIVCFGLLGLLVLCRILSFLSQDCLRRIEINDDRVILHRVLGKKIEVSYDQLIWISDNLRANKTHSFSTAKIENHDALKELLMKHVVAHACDQQEAADKPLKKSNKLNWWHDIFVLLGILIVVAIIIAFYYLSKIEPTDQMMWIFDGILGLGAVAYIISIIRKMFFGTAVVDK